MACLIFRRERVIHMLAVRPMKKIEISAALRKGKCEKRVPLFNGAENIRRTRSNSSADSSWFKRNISFADGVRDSDKLLLSSTLMSVATIKDNVYHLLRHMWNDVLEDWPFYSDEERDKMQRWDHHSYSYSIAIVLLLSIRISLFTGIKKQMCCQSSTDYRTAPICLRKIPRWVTSRHQDLATSKASTAFLQNANESHTSIDHPSRLSHITFRITTLVIEYRQVASPMASMISSRNLGCLAPHQSRHRRSNLILRFVQTKPMNPSSVIFPRAQKMMFSRVLKRSLIGMNVISQT